MRIKIRNKTIRAIVCILIMILTPIWIMPLSIGMMLWHCLWEPAKWCILNTYEDIDGWLRHD